jgi:hypothetical protein
MFAFGFQDSSVDVRVETVKAMVAMMLVDGDVIAGERSTRQQSVEQAMSVCELCKSDDTEL